MKYYRISFFSEYYNRGFWFEIDEENEQKISLKLDELLDSRKNFKIEKLKIDFIDGDVSNALTKALEHNKMTFQNTSVSQILYTPIRDRPVKKYDLGKMLVNAFSVDEENRLSNVDVVFNYGNDVLAKD